MVSGHASSAADREFVPRSGQIRTGIQCVSANYKRASFNRNVTHSRQDIADKNAHLSSNNNNSIKN